jgi:two-component system, chemotaxis family, chemotaxis protein CheY
MAIDRHMPVLVVDDNGTTRRIVRSQLRQLGFVDVDEANSGAEALVKLYKRRYGLIFSDWHIEEISGLDLLRAVRGDQGLQRVPFIMVTGESRTDNVIAATICREHLQQNAHLFRSDSRSNRPTAPVGVADRGAKVERRRGASWPAGRPPFSC